MAHKRTDLHINEIYNTIQEVLRIEIFNKDKIEKNSQMIGDLLDQNVNKITNVNSENDKAIDEVMQKCCEINNKVKHNYQILIEKKENTKITENQNDKISNEILENINSK